MSGVVRLSREEAVRLRGEAKLFLRSKWSLNLEELAHRGWTAALIAEPFLDRAHAVWLAESAGSLGISEGHAVVTEDEPEAFRVEFSAGALRHLHAEALLRPFLLWPRGVEFVVLDQGNYFMVVAGPGAFVRKAVGGSIIEARRAYERYVLSADFSAKTRNWMLAAGRRYADLPAL